MFRQNINLLDLTLVYYDDEDVTEKVTDDYGNSIVEFRTNSEIVDQLQELGYQALTIKGAGTTAELKYIMRYDANNKHIYLVYNVFNSNNKIDRAELSNDALWRISQSELVFDGEDLNYCPVWNSVN